MIATVTLNPAVDKTLNGQQIILGSINRMETVNNIAGGKGINVAKVLKAYNYDVKTLGFIGGYTGDMIKRAVNDMGITEAFTNISGLTRTSINVITEDGYVTEILEPGPQVTDKEIESFLNDYKKHIASCEYVVISGSAPRGIDPSLYGTLIRIANELGVKVILDASGDNLKKGIYERPYFIKPNLKELEAFKGRKIDGLDNIAKEAMELVEWGIENVCVSLGSKGMILSYRLADDNIETLYVKAPCVKVINTVGSGDSAVAAFTMGDMDKLSKEETIKQCVAISAANVCSLENGIIDIELAEKIKSELKCEKRW